VNTDAPDSQNGFDRLFSEGRLLSLLGLLIVISVPGVVLGTDAFFYRDTGLFSYPVAYYLRDSLRHGQWPLWNPCSNCGLPFLAQWNTLALYPFSLFYVLLPMPWSLNFFLLGHLLLGGSGMYRLAHDWFGNRFAASVAALAFAWNGLSLQFLMWPCHNAALAWMPWVILHAQRAAKEGERRVYWAALAGACQMLTGSPETILLTWLIVAACFLHGVALKELSFWAGGRRLIGVAALTGALSAAQLLPTLDFLAHGDRTSASGAWDWSLPPWGLANFLVPLFHSTGSLSGVFMQQEQQWTSSYYVGVLPLLLALLALWRQRAGRTRLLAVLALAGVLLALGRAGWVLQRIEGLLPLLGFIRYPVKFIILTVFCLTLLAGAGAAWLQARPRQVARRSLPAPAALLGAAVLLILAVQFWFPFPSDSWSAVRPNALGRLLVLAAGTALLALIFNPKPAPGRALFSFAFLLLSGLDVCTHAPWQNPTIPVQGYDPYPPPMTWLPRLGESRAMLSAQAQRTMENLVTADPLRLYLGQRAELFGDCNLLNGIPKVDGFFSLHLAAPRKVAALLAAERASPRLAGFLGVSQIASPRALFHWEAQTNFMPLATIGQKPVFLDDAAALAALSSDAFEPRRAVYLPPDARGHVTAGADGQARLLSSRVSPSECVFETRADSPTMLVVAQAYYHCWRARVDGRPVPLWRANYAYQALEVPSGGHQVRLEYVDRAFQTGAVISVAALLLCLGAGFWKTRATRKIPGAMQMAESMWVSR
jgi:hypothetical protein